MSFLPQPAALLNDMASALILYQYFHPDDVVSSVHLTELAQGLVRRGWDVAAMPCNRSCRDSSQKYPKKSTHDSVSIARIWRPPFPQASGWGRVANCLWTIGAWSVRALTNNPDLVIIGTDPVLSAAAVIPWKFLRRGTRAVHWCFDLYPEAAVADGILKPGLGLSALRSIMRAAYKRFDLLVDIGDCMRERLSKYESSAKTITLAPWALLEPAAPLAVDPSERNALFGDAKLGLMYSGNFGRAHAFAELLTLARLLRNADAHFAFIIRGNGALELRDAIRPEDRNISFAPFAPQERLQARLGAADIQVVSLRSEWTGTVVPSKFFGALAAGRPVLFIGSEESYIARTIRKYELGWVCAPGQESAIADTLRALVDRPSSMDALCIRCHRVYQNYFARELLLDNFNRELRSLLVSSREEVFPGLPDQAATSVALNQLERKMRSIAESSKSGEIVDMR